VSDEEIARFYNDNKDRFNVQQRLKLRHILVDGEAEAKAILAELKKGADFSKLASEKSKCPSSQKGGDLGWVMKGMMVPEFEKAAFELKKGQKSNVVKTNFGYHIIMNDDEEAAKQRELTEVKDMIVKQIQGEKGEEAVGKLIEQVKKDYPVTFNETFFSAGQNEKAADKPSKP
jgi:peptidyl-prolyl cis-trans isomerase C